MTSTPLGWSNNSNQSSNRWPAPAKLNLFLHITGRRDDGYHLLQTVFQLLDYGDELAFTRRADQRITLTLSPANDALSGSDNLVLRAAALLQQHSGVSADAVCGVDITLYKRLPAGAGLGGGSSDAATTLVALNHLWQLGLNIEVLAAFGLQLGADVPVFVRARSAWAEGVGEDLQPIELPDRWFVVINPSVHVATSTLFGCSQLTRDCTPITIRGFQNGVTTGNVFEPLVCRLEPRVAQALNELQQHAHQHGCKEPRMTGTGSSVFLECETQTRAQNVLDAVTGRVHGLDGFIARGLDHSALLHYS
ncbi:MAG: 4-(cytidine 5'-diphospho)-2-C-methyl-D-erythritol kinase [Pseudomonadota bacterium]